MFVEVKYPSHWMTKILTPTEQNPIRWLLALYAYWNDLKRVLGIAKNEIIMEQQDNFNRINFNGLKLKAVSITRLNRATRYNDIKQIVETQNERSLQEIFNKERNFNGFIFYDGEKPIGQIFYTVSRAGKFQPMFLIVHPEYQNRNLSRLFVGFLLQANLGKWAEVGFRPFSKAQPHMSRIIHELGTPKIIEDDYGEEDNPIAYLLSELDVRKNLPKLFEKLDIVLN